MLREELTSAMKDAMRAKEKCKLGTVRLILAAVKDRDIELRTKSDEDRDDDAMVTDIMVKMVKQRNDSIKAYEEAGRLELAEREREEIEIIKTFLPAQLSDDEISAICSALIEELSAEGLKDIGRCMAALKEKYTGQMDMASASKTIKALLS